MRLHDQESPDTIARGLTGEPVAPTNFNRWRDVVQHNLDVLALGAADAA
jgi:hypothetical protein